MKNTLLNFFTQIFASTLMFVGVASLIYGEFPPPLRKIKKDIAEFHNVSKAAITLPQAEIQHQEDLQNALAVADGDFSRSAKTAVSPTPHERPTQVVPLNAPPPAELSNQIRYLNGRILVLEDMEKKQEERLHAMETMLSIKR